MKIVFSRKGFDSGSGKAASPIIEGRPISLPIPATKEAVVTYKSLGLGEVVEEVTKGKISRADFCHHDPMFVNGECVFGQQGAAQAHLARNGIGPGDLFLFFGLFTDEHTRERHHRIFGYLKVERVCAVAELSATDRADLRQLDHPHVVRALVTNDTIYRGEGLHAAKANPELRLTRPGGPVSQWIVPPWLPKLGLTYHGDTRRWAKSGELTLVSRGQEFVCDIGDHPEATAWVASAISTIASKPDIQGPKSEPPNRS